MEAFLSIDTVIFAAMFALLVSNYSKSSKRYNKPNPVHGRHRFLSKAFLFAKSYNSATLIFKNVWVHYLQYATYKRFETIDNNDDKIIGCTLG